MKQTVRKWLALFLLVGIFFAIAGCKTQEEIDRTQSQLNAKTVQEIVIKQELEREQRLMEVTGMGKVDADPDVATIYLAVTVQGKNAEEVNENNRVLLDTVFAAIKSVGVADEDIRTQEITVPVHETIKGVSEIVGYTVTNTITVRLHNVTRTGDLVTTAMQAGVEILQIEYHLLDETAAYQEALAVAVLDAKKKAATMAASAGVDLEGPVSMHENIEVMQNITKVLVYESTALNVQSADDQEALQTTAIQPSQITVSAEVLAVFQMKWPSTSPTENE